MGARVITGPGAGPRVRAPRGRRRRAVERIGDLTLTFLHTPGHTSEHITIARRRARRTGARSSPAICSSSAPSAAPICSARRRRAQLADQLFDSLQRMMRIDPDVEVHPGHGAGSLCGAGIGTEPSSTIARERQQNPMLRTAIGARRVRPAVLADLPETPPYFARMKRVNRQDLRDRLRAARGGCRRSGRRRRPRSPPTARSSSICATGRGVRRRASRWRDQSRLRQQDRDIWAGWVLPPDAPLLLMADDPGAGAGRRRPAASRRARSGRRHDRRRASTPGRPPRCRSRDSTLMSPADCATATAPCQVIDVRTRARVAGRPRRRLDQHPGRRNPSVASRELPARGTDRDDL